MVTVVVTAVDRDVQSGYRGEPWRSMRLPRRTVLSGLSIFLSPSRKEMHGRTQVTFHFHKGNAWSHAEYVPALHGKCMDFASLTEPQFLGLR